MANLHCVADDCFHSPGIKLLHDVLDGLGLCADQLALLGAAAVVVPDLS